nr:probable WRKY transcription factor 51 isoform X1 [Populus alba]
MDYPQNPKPSCNYSYTNEGLDPWTIELQPSDYLMLDDGFGEDSSSQNMVSSEQVASGSSTGYSGATSRNNSIKCKNGVNKNKTEEEHRVAFRTKSDLEIMDDGYKWRKYGKKSVKNSPNPRHNNFSLISLIEHQSSSTLQFALGILRPLPTQSQSPPQLRDQRWWLKSEQ